MILLDEAELTKVLSRWRYKEWRLTRWSFGFVTISKLIPHSDLESYTRDEGMDDQTWSHLLIEQLRHDWVVYAKAPLGGPQQLLDYLSRYTHRVGISNERLLSLQDGQVRFKVRDNTHAGKKRIKQLQANEFTRFLQHVLPTGFKRIRH